MSQEVNPFHQLQSFIDFANSMTKGRKTVSIKVDGGIRIAVLQRGWVAVGKYSRLGTECRLDNAYIVRRWGTTEGLPELAAKGPLKDTKLEPSASPIRFHRSAEVLTIDCDPSKWEKCQ